MREVKNVHPTRKTRLTPGTLDMGWLYQLLAIFLMVRGEGVDFGWSLAIRDISRSAMPI